MTFDDGALENGAMWLVTRRSTADGRACRDHTVHDASGSPLLTARAFNWRREIVLRSASAEEAVIVLVRRRSFPFTGRVDVRDAATRARIGVVSRSGRVFDANGRPAGRFRDARSLRGRSREALLAGLLDAAVGNEGGSDVSSASAFVYLARGEPAGTLTRAKLPFDVAPRSEQTGRRYRLRHWLPTRVGRLFDDLRAPRGWHLVRDPRNDVAPRLFIAAAIFTVELTHW